MFSAGAMPGPTPDPGNAAVNINYVHGMSDTAAQTWMHPLAWLALMMTALPVALYAPVHLILARVQRGSSPATTKAPQSPLESAGYSV